MAHGLQVGDKFLSLRSVEPVELLAGTAAQAEAARRLAGLWRSWCVPLDLSTLWDAMAVGARSISRYETLYLFGVVSVCF